MVAASAAAAWAVRHATSAAVRGWSPPSGRRTVAGPLAVRRLGTGEHDQVVVLLHGLTASGDWWGGGYDALTAQAEVVVPDLLGFGASMDIDRTDFSREAHLDALDEMLAELGLDGRPLTVVGHSMGTLAALHWAARRPETVQVVAFCAPLYADRAEAERHIAEIGPLERFFALNTGVAERSCALMCAHRSTAQWLWTAVSPQWPVRLARHGVLHTWDAYLGGIEGLIIRGDWEAAISALDARGVPVLLADGADDPVPVSGRAAQLEAVYDCVDTAQHPTAGHDLPAAYPDWALTRILQSSTADSPPQQAAHARTAEPGTAGRERNAMVSHPVFARVYEHLSRRMEQHGNAEHRRRLLADLHGRVIEVGAGNGLNFAHYPSGVDEVLAVEPEPRLRHAATRAAGSAAVPITVVDGIADALPAADSSFDAAVASLVLCSVPDQQVALAELDRVLRPGGELRFYEHVRSDEPGLAAVQRAVDHVWPRLAGGCHTSRRTVDAIEAAGFVIDDLVAFRFPETRVPLPPAPHVMGVARKASP